MSLSTCTVADSKRKNRSCGKSSCNNKENVNPMRKEDYSESYAEKVLRDVKVSANKTFLNVKGTFDNISQRIRRSARRDNSSLQQYSEFEDKERTPIKMYSPFGIVTPSPQKEEHKSPVRNLLTPRRFIFASPTGKIKQDIADLSSGLEELNTVAKSIQLRKGNGK